MDAVPDPDGADTLLAGRYELGPLVGLGGTAEVYRAWDRYGFCPVAVKIFRPGAAPTPGYGGERELQVLTGVRHPGLVGVRGAGVDAQGCPFVVMDFIDGESLSARLNDGPLPAAAVAGIGAVLADALAAVHARGVVHRDVKPANVLLDTDDRPWLTDFGIARIVDATRVTATGVVVGTAAYMAPEQVRGETVGPPADVYSLGLVLLEAVTGRREYGGGAVESALARLHRVPLVPADLPDPLGATLSLMTAPDPRRRPTAAAVASALGDPTDPIRRPAGRIAVLGRRAAPAAALACLVAGALGGALALVGPDRAGESAAAAAVPTVVPAAVPPAPLGAVPPAGAGAAGAGVPPAQPMPVALRNPDGTGAAAPGGNGPADDPPGAADTDAGGAATGGGDAAGDRDGAGDQDGAGGGGSSGGSTDGGSGGGGSGGGGSGGGGSGGGGSGGGGSGGGGSPDDAGDDDSNKKDKKEKKDKKDKKDKAG
jgi:hypothetical protein